MSSVDMVNNVYYEEVYPNVYNIDITIKRMSDNAHCARSGYRQVADAFYGVLKAQY